jgi:hypothetical protein
VQVNPHQSAAPSQSVQEPTDNRMVNFGTTNQIPPLAGKIAPSVMKIRRDVDPNLYNQIVAS